MPLRFLAARHIPREPRCGWDVALLGVVAELFSVLVLGEGWVPQALEQLGVLCQPSWVAPRTTGISLRPAQAVPRKRSP